MKKNSPALMVKDTLDPLRKYFADPTTGQRISPDLTAQEATDWLFQQGFLQPGQAVQVVRIPTHMSERVDPESLDKLLNQQRPKVRMLNGWQI